MPVPPDLSSFRPLFRAVHDSLEGEIQSMESTRDSCANQTQANIQAVDEEQAEGNKLRNRVVETKSRVSGNKSRQRRQHHSPLTLTS